MTRNDLLKVLAFWIAAFIAIAVLSYLFQAYATDTKPKKFHIDYIGEHINPETWLVEVAKCSPEAVESNEDFWSCYEREPAIMIQVDRGRLVWVIYVYIDNERFEKALGAVKTHSKLDYSEDGTDVYLKGGYAILVSESDKIMAFTKTSIHME